MISIITPFFNSEKYLKDTVESVINQSYENWELLLINDGSTDLSQEIALSFQDERIRYFEQENKGVSAARNVGLSSMSGDFFCFLDADDVLPADSLKYRRAVFNSDSKITFVDGYVCKMDFEMEVVKQRWRPDFQGNPLSDLVRLTGHSFFGPSWMIKRDVDKLYTLEGKLTHAEDLFFYMNLAKQGGKYAFTPSSILHYRDTPHSAMKNLKGLEDGYRFIESQLRTWGELSLQDIRIYKYKWRKSMFLSYLRQKQFSNALNALR